MTVRHYEEHMESPELLYHLYLPMVKSAGQESHHNFSTAVSGACIWMKFLPALFGAGHVSYHGCLITSCCCVHPCDLFPHSCWNALCCPTSEFTPHFYELLYICGRYCCPECNRRLFALYRMPVQVAVHYKDLQQNSILAIKKNFNLNLGKRLFCFRKLCVTLQLKLLKGALFQLRGFLIILDFKYDCGISSREKQLWTTFCYSYLTFLYMCHIQCVHFKTKWGISVFFRIHSKP